uniref:Uncharacterized protein n=1 Tax=Rhizophora mucronata TaxID=61149 RepID=A0A2P2J9V9_RHIMU
MFHLSSFSCPLTWSIFVGSLSNSGLHVQIHTYQSETFPLCPPTDKTIGLHEMGTKLFLLLVLYNFKFRSRFSPTSPPLLLSKVLVAWPVCIIVVGKKL